MNHFTIEFKDQLNRLNATQNIFETKLSYLWFLGIRDFYNMDKEKNDKLTESYLKLFGMMKKLLLVNGTNLYGEKILTFNDKVCEDFFKECINFKNMIIGNYILQEYINSAYITYKEYSAQIKETINHLLHMGYRENEIHIGSLGYESILKRAKFDEDSINFSLDGGRIKNNDLYSIPYVYPKKYPFYNYDCHCFYKVIIGDLMIYGLKNVPFNHIDIITHNLGIIYSEIQGKSLGVKVVGGEVNIEGSNLKDISSINCLGGSINVNGTPIAKELGKKPIVLKPEDIYDISSLISLEESDRAADIFKSILMRNPEK